LIIVAMFGTKPRKVERLDFIVAGAQKSGTTALHYFLSKHPEIALPDKQELHFFDDEERFAGEANYNALHGSFHLKRRWSIAGECTPIYVYWKPAIERIWKYDPKIKLLVLLRNPIERAFAHWNMQRFKGREPLDFLEAVKEEKNRMQEALPLQLRRFSYVDRGFYSEQLARLFKFFPREQIKIIKSEEFRDKNRAMLDSVFRFLGVRPLIGGRNKDRNVVPYERAITPEERQCLHDIFSEDIAKVEQMLGWDCSDWRLL